MDYDIKYIGDIGVIELRNDLDLIELPELKNIFRETYHSGIFKIIIDLKNVGTINSTAVGLLISEWNRLKKVEGTIVLCNANPFIKKILTIVGADKLIKIYNSREKAIKALKNDGK